MCQGAVTYTAPENGRGNVVRNRRPSINWDAVEAQQVADEEKYGIRRSNPLENDEKYFKRVGEYRQAENDKIERERRAVTAQQMTRRAELEAAAAAAEASALAEAERATIRFKGDRAVLEQQTNQKRRAGQAVGQSLRILAMTQGQAQGRPATISKRRSASRGSRRTTASLSIGQTGNSGGSGSNLSI